MAFSHPPEARLLARREFLRVCAEGQSHHHPLVVLRCAPSEHGPQAPTRFGITVSRRISTRATVRNRARRLWREAIRHLRPQFAPGHDIVLNAKPACARGMTAAQAHEALLTLARDAGLLAGNPSP